MKALVFDKELKLVDYKKPTPAQGEALVRVTLAGICNTDIEITKGYKGFSGILGHEAIGVVEEINASDSSLLGKRVVPEINFGCGKCSWCARGLSSHCPDRRTLGIAGKDGCFAEYFTAPLGVLHEVADTVSDEQAVFVEPLAAALEIVEQLHLKPSDKVLVLGDGKLGTTIALSLCVQNFDTTLVGLSQSKLKIASLQGVKTALLQEIKTERAWDAVVEATGTVSGFETALALVRPRGVLVLKSTVASGKELNLAPIVINEITVLGSRCGPFEPALRLMEKAKIDFIPMISEIYTADRAIEAFEKSREEGVLKVLIRFG
ncbi:MAG: alcohol dehydrogenase catalytic domain-containing protein [Oscillospiraceae bacterium]|nr:alcohol dehydrogenase catalytic domain-containing protein [Oscillospiraceae bacterium]MCL2278519.1 alcohol dehydrogenase catalytic domain-containing protein [Oscillospiraceae bacterium]